MGNDNQPLNFNFSLNVEVKRDDVIQLALEWLGDDGVPEILENKWAEMGDDPGDLPLDLAKAFSFVALNVLASHLTSKLLYPDDDAAAFEWARQKFQRALFELSHHESGPDPGDEPEPMFDVSIKEGASIVEVVEARLQLWKELMLDERSTPIMLISLNVEDGNLNLMSANDMNAHEVLDALSELTLFMVEQAMTDERPDCEHPRTSLVKGHRVCLDCGAIGML